MLADTEIRVETKWREDYAASLVNVSEHTRRAYLQDIGRFCAWFWQEYELVFTPDQITAVDLRNYRNYLLNDRSAKPSTWNRRLMGLRRFCQWAVQAGYLSQDPSVEIKTKPSEELPPRWLDKKQLRNLLRQLEKQVNTASTPHARWQACRDQAIVGLMLYAGLREGEVVALNLNDLTIGERSGKVVIHSGKGDKRAEIPLGVEVRRILLHWREEKRFDKFLNNQHALFINRTGDRLNVRSVQRMVKALGTQAGVDVSPHDLRHTFAKRLLDGGVALTTVQKLLRHARLETTARYVKPGWGDLEDAVERV